MLYVLHRDDQQSTVVFRSPGEFVKEVVIVFEEIIKTDDADDEPPETRIDIDVIRLWKHAFPDSPRRDRVNSVLMKIRSAARSETPYDPTWVDIAEQCEIELSELVISIPRDRDGAEKLLELAGYIDSTKLFGGLFTAFKAHYYGEDSDEEDE